jgi:hypothetical protein
MMIIANQSGTIEFLYEPGLLEWLQANYPYSNYQLVEVDDEVVS